MARKHGLTMDVPFTLHFPDRSRFRAEVRLRGYGAVNGMLLVSDESILEDKSPQLVEMGYGYSCFCQPISEGAIESDERLTDILDDWGKV